MSPSEEKDTVHKVITKILSHLSRTQRKINMYRCTVDVCLLSLHVWYVLYYANLKIIHRMNE